MPIAPPASLNQFEEWAEDAFAMTGTGTDVVINPPRRDRRGWDFLAEWDVIPSPGLSSDKQLKARTARIQVKSNRQAKPVARLKLTNALKFAEAIDPCFVVLYWLNKNRSEVEIYAKHFDKVLLEKTLKRACEADRDGRTDHHNIEILIAMTHSDLHTDDLILWIKAQCAEAPALYAQQKARLHKTVGFEDQQLVGTFNVGSEEVPALIEHAVGLATPFNPKWIEMRETRFGIPATMPLIAGEPAHFDLKAKPRPAAVIFRSPDRREAKFAGEMRSFHIPGYEMPGTLIAAFNSPAITGKFYNDLRFDLNYRLNGPENHDVRLMSDLLRFFVMMFDGGVTSTLELEGKEIATAPISQAPQQKYERFYRWAETMVDGLTRHIKKADRPRLSVANLVDEGQNVEQFIACFMEGVTTLKVELKDPEKADVRFASLMGYAYVAVAGFTYAVYFRKPICSHRKDGNMLIAEFSNTEVLDGWAKPGSLDRNMPAVRKRFAALRARATGGTLFAYDGDMILATTTHTDFEVTGSTDDLTVEL